uniref:Amino acid transporter n=1 Tax=Panagrellus redivivus TaxID=6233 RepID=A0A7E4WA51_PANRE
MTHGNENVDFSHYSYVPSFFAVILMVFMVKNLLSHKVFEHFTDWNSVTTFVKEKKGDALFNAVKCTIYHAKQKPGITTLMMLKCVVEIVVLCLMIVSIPMYMGIPIGSFFSSLFSDWKRMAGFFPFDILCHVFLPSVGNVNRLSVPCVLSANKWYTVVTIFVSRDATWL